MKKTLILIALLMGLNTANAASPLKTDFAFGSRIELTETAALYRFTIPPHVYRNVADSQLPDVRIFNGDGETVPFTIRPAPAKPICALPPAPLPLFPLFESTGAQPDTLALHFKSDSTGRVLDLRNHPVTEKKQIISGYLIDISQLKEPPATLKTTLTKVGKNFVGTIRVEKSDDLTHWTPLVSGASLAILASGGNRLTRRQIHLPGFKAKYLRLQWHHPAMAPRLTAVTAFFPEKNGEPGRESLRLSGWRDRDTPNVFEFDTRGFFPVDRINLGLAGDNQLLKAKLFSRKTPEDHWRHRHIGLFHTLRVQDTPLENDPVVLHPVTDPYWKVEILSGTPPEKKTGPELEIGWVPGQCHFLAAGSPPFFLAYGNAHMDPAAKPLDDLLKKIEAKPHHAFMGHATIGPPVLVGGEARLKPSLMKTAPWRKWALWSTLILSVALLGWMAWRLSRQMGGTPETPLDDKNK